MQENPITYISFFPLPFIFCLIILAVLVIRARKKGRTYGLVTGIFGGYVIAVLMIVFFPIPVSVYWPDNLHWSNTLREIRRVNLIPLWYPGLFHFSIKSIGMLVDIVLNILLTIPVGICVPILKPGKPKFILGLAFATGFLMEIAELAVQLVTGIHYHVVTMNDVVMNALGVLTGYGILISIRWLNTQLKRGNPGNHIISQTSQTRGNENQ